MSCLERCNEFARTPTARVIFWVVIALSSVFFIYRLATKNDKDFYLENEKAAFKVIIDKNTHEGAFVHIKPDNSSPYALKIEEFLAPYRVPSPNRKKCDYPHPRPVGESCNFDFDELSKLCKQPRACIYLTLGEKNWEEAFYNEENFPEDMPRDIQEHIKEFRRTPENINFVGVSCSGEGPVDVENLREIIYLPSRYFHFYKDSGVLKPMEPAIVMSASVKTQMVTFLKCTLWTREPETISIQLLVEV